MGFYKLYEKYMSKTVSSAFKKKFGIFYTPSEISKILSYWAIRSPNENILEPSFGGCGFLEASKNRLLELGNNRAHDKLFGADKNRKAFDYLYNKIGPINLKKQFLHSDFLRLTPEDFLSKKFDVIIGNPPYISHHNISKIQKASAQKAIRSSEFTLNGRASIWAHFIMHSLSFLKSNGRMAWVLPHSFLNSNYSESIKKALKQKFKRLLVIAITERLFLAEGTDERTVLLLAEGFENGPSENGLEIAFAQSKKMISQFVESWSSAGWHGKQLKDRSNLSSISSTALSFYNEIAANINTIHLGDIANILIGIVTGANKFFILNKDTARRNKIPEASLKKIFSKFAFATGIKLKKADFDQLMENNMRCLFVDSSRIKRNNALFAYIDSFPKELKKLNATFEKRPVWHKSDDGRIPDAFLSYMNQEGPKLVLNYAKVNSTNTIHRIYFKQNLSVTLKKLACISMMSTFSQLSAEIEGRTYGSGVLKIEPSEGKRILVIFQKNLNKSKIKATYLKIDKLLRAGQLSEARHEADKFILRKYFKDRRVSDLKSLTQSLIDLRHFRQNTAHKIT